MFITAHTSAALWISTRITDPILAFILGIASHFLFDMIPHGDESLADHVQGKKEKFKYFIRVALIDMILATILVYFFVSHGPIVDPYVLYPAVLGTWLPDIAWITIEYLKLSKLYWYIYFHSKVHNFFNWQYSIVYGVPFQIIVTLAVLKISF
ncbi:MAG: hypothetical protein HOE19_01095 [Candidatus Komeilibacteria bacterium]|mgnify:FL=1|jgi:hypothetical protein|nr:hypothetical protein [Candidatus Komeilibacteria bacterium]MBT4447141.1 hypothetical protein [Candidatus Komeilibacteria bacterium]